MDPVELDETNKLLQTAQLLRLSEAGFARDHHGRITQEADPDGQKLDWYCLGLLDGLRRARGYHRKRLRLLAYLMLLCETAPGETVRRSTERLLASLGHANPARYIDAGRCTVRRLLAGQRVDPGNYAELLVADVAVSRRNN